MQSYTNADYLVLDGVLILYTGIVSERIVIPRIIDGQTIKKIGRSAFQDCTFIKSITIPDSVTRIESSAFIGCSNLKEIALPIFYNDIHIEADAFVGCKSLERILATATEKEYQRLVSSARSLADGTLVIMSEQKIKTMLCAMSGYIEATPIDTKYIFNVKDYAVNTILGKLVVYGLKDKLTIIEDEAVMNHISTGDMRGPFASDNETQIDWHVRANKPAEYRRTALTYFYPSETMRLGEKVHIKIMVSDGYHFVQSLVKIIYSGKDFYVYRRHYLSPIKEELYTRQDITVYDRNGLVENQEVAKEVYAKYMLLALL